MFFVNNPGRYLNGDTFFCAVVLSYLSDEKNFEYHFNKIFHNVSRDIVQECKNFLEQYNGNVESLKKSKLHALANEKLKELNKKHPNDEPTVFEEICEKLGHGIVVVDEKNKTIHSYGTFCNSNKLRLAIADGGQYYYLDTRTKEYKHDRVMSACPEPDRLPALELVEFYAKQRDLKEPEPSQPISQHERDRNTLNINFPKGHQYSKSNKESVISFLKDRISLARTLPELDLIFNIHFRNAYLAERRWPDIDNFIAFFCRVKYTNSQIEFIELLRKRFLDLLQSGINSGKIKISELDHQQFKYGYFAVAHENRGVCKNFHKKLNALLHHEKQHNRTYGR